MLAVPLDRGFKMTRFNYWAFVIGGFGGIFLYAFLCGLADREPSSNAIELFAMIFMWFVGYARLRDAGCKHTWPAIFAPLVIGLIWIGCIGDRTPTTLELEDD